MKTLIPILSAVLFLFGMASANSGPKEISRAELRDKIHGYWIGQIAGNYLGFPFENLYEEEPIPILIDRYYDYRDAGPADLKMNLTDRRSFTPIMADAMGGAWSDDDTDIEFVTLHAVELHGLDMSYEDLMGIWKVHVNRFIWAAARNARDLMEEGVSPPETGSRERNARWFGISSQLMTEIWGAFYPGMPERAGERAEWNAKMLSDEWATHPDIAYVSMYSSAFFEDDVKVLVDRAIAALPEASPYRQGMEDVREWKAQYSDWRDARKRMHERYFERIDGVLIDYPLGGAVINGLAGTMAILYGEGDYLKTVSIATSLGYDCDNQAATCGGLLGIMHGGSSIPERLTLDLPSRGRWEEPFNDLYINYSRDGLPNVTRISDIVDRILAIAERAILENGGQKVGSGENSVYRIP
ncbi:ADP-ribosylglycohydrolase family protein [Pelagicoccus sp. SDUM812002]|uniref:ADP-ribosylglycohydrolase family protein n=1 Tax=Pelagicoccus sp. SDUM812002 TaxID=3041266 RepID=UPI00280E53F7|nr:ADP-ribosylglycohydrolase family protein [Pelagicoccus sp. SDUM812002]MDQ8186859.1 ADP-ribosylglycohydrolase family protein [Pelagicoccus sp. SDUM812002]